MTLLPDGIDTQDLAVNLTGMDATGLGPIAIVDDDPTIRRIVQAWLEEKGYETIVYERGAAIVRNMSGLSAVFLDLHLDDMSGLDVLLHLKAKDPELPVLVMTSEDEVQTAVGAMKAGAYDYLVKPLERPRLLVAALRAIERRDLSTSLQRLQNQLNDRYLIDSIVGQSGQMRELARQIERVLQSDVAVAIFGESGTGKELVARAVHHSGRRRAGPFVAINCAAIPESLQESELFGHERGAFTGAVGVHQGRFEQAHGGTLFLDEIGEMSAMTQASLLRTLQERTIRRVGGTEEIPVDVRIVCATHRDLLHEVQAGRFREDLYFRMVVYPIRIPALRERKEDIPLLVGHFMQKHKDDVPCEVTRVSADVLEVLEAQDWAGNVRELENVIHRAMLACDGGELGLKHLPADLRGKGLPEVPPLEGEGQPSGQADDLGFLGVGPGEVLQMQELERRAIKRALRLTGGSVEKAAKLLGMGRATLYRRLASYDTAKR